MSRGQEAFDAYKAKWGLTNYRFVVAPQYTTWGDLEAYVIHKYNCGAKYILGSHEIRRVDTLVKAVKQVKRVKLIEVNDSYYLHSMAFESWQEFLCYMLTRRFAGI